MTDLAQLETPFLTSDLDAVERNIARAQEYCDSHGLALRPHVKTHKQARIARMQLDAGAVGITCQKLGEAEVMADAGVEDILVTFPVLGETKVERLAALARLCRMSIAADSPAAAVPVLRSASSSSATQAAGGSASRHPKLPRSSPRKRPGWKASSCSGS